MSVDASRPQATVSTQLLTRVVILLIAIWDSLAGLVLLAFQGAGTGALGAGLEDVAAQRLLGAHLLVLVPLYGLLAWRLDHYRGLMWLPFSAQAAVMLVIGYNMLEGDTSFGDGILGFGFSLVFVSLLSFVWVTEQRTLAHMQMEAKAAGAASVPPALPPPGPQS